MAVIRKGAWRLTPMNTITRHQITHTLRIPLMTFASRPQLQKSMERMRDDPITGALSRSAWLFGDSLTLMLGALSLPTPERLATAREALKTFRFASKPESKHDKPIHVTLHGLNSGWPGEQRPFTHRLYTHVTDAALLSHFEFELQANFKCHGLLVEDKGNRDQRSDRRRPHDGRRPVGGSVQPKIMSTRYLKSDQKNEKPDLQQYNLLRPPLFDARDLYAAYSDTIWAKDILLEEICITELAPKDFMVNNEVIGQGWQSIFSVPLPGAAQEARRSEDRNITYVKAAKTIFRNQPITPLIIPSNSQPVAVGTDADFYDRFTR